MFYTYLRGLVAFYSVGFKWNAHYHHRQYSRSGRELHPGIPHRTWWDPVYMAFATKPKAIYLYG